MTRLMAALLLLAGCTGSSAPSYHGSWIFSSDGGSCRVRITQSGGDVHVEAASLERAWTCEGRGRIRGGLCEFDWAGRNDRGRARLHRDGDNLTGAFIRDGDSEGPHSVVGRRAR